MSQTNANNVPHTIDARITGVNPEGETARPTLLVSIAHVEDPSKKGQILLSSKESTDLMNSAEANVPSKLEGEEVHAVYEGDKLVGLYK